MEFNDKVVIITGGSSGIGAAAAIHFANQSAKLVLVGRKENNLRQIALYCEKAKGIKPLAITADVTEDTDLERIVKETVEHFGKLDVLVNNAGVVSMGGMKNSNMEDYDKVMSTNMRAVYCLTMLATPHLIATKGCIVNVSSIASTKPNVLTISYNVSKAALDQFTKCVALELAGDGVRVNSVNPGFVKTNLLKDCGLSEEQMEMVVQNVASNQPLQKPLQADEVAGLVAFLASDKAKSITGSCFVIDGGSTLKRAVNNGTTSARENCRDCSRADDVIALDGSGGRAPQPRSYFVTDATGKRYRRNRRHLIKLDPEVTFTSSSHHGIMNDDDTDQSTDGSVYDDVGDSVDTASDIMDRGMEVQTDQANIVPRPIGDNIDNTSQRIPRAAALEAKNRLKQ